ncbi:MAG: hypothetical protein QME32_06830 [Endomicrobiia bacterium]|nr:hypothetical protein [Endomicrobiia bacterium]
MKAEWEREPNKKSWKHAGLKCRVLRHPHFKHLCGYVQIPAEWLEKISAIIIVTLLSSIDVHDGGISFIGELKGEKGWWCGFDCAHPYDFIPAIHSDYPVPELDTVYCNMAYVTTETNFLAEQIATLKKSYHRGGKKDK